MPTTHSKQRCAGWRNWPPKAETPSAGSELVEGLRQCGLLVGRLILVDDTLAGGLVQLTVGRDQQLGGLVLLASVDGLTQAANSGPKGRLHRLVAQSGALVGTDALFLRLDVGHALIPSKAELGVLE